jgi:hypothetical protein
LRWHFGTLDGRRCKQQCSDTSHKQLFHFPLSSELKFLALFAV